MSFNGDLEHFPLVDVIQLLHMTSKTGVLNLKSAKGESQLAFQDGFLVSANHLNNSIRIGKVLVDMGAITPEQLNQALVEQKEAGGRRKPIIATLIEQGTINRDTAFRGLESLIEMTIVEVLTWDSGTFSLDVATECISDEYRYFPETLQQKILLDAQGILMDSLRIYDERMRDGTLSTLFFATENGTNAELWSGESDATEITADLLGLDELDTITRKIPDVFIGLKDHNPDNEHRQAVALALPAASAEQQEQLVSCLSAISRQTPSTSAPPVTAVILLTSDALLSHAVSTVCKRENLFVFASDEENALDMVIEQSLGRDLHPVLLIDIPHDGDGERNVALVRQKIAAYPQISIVLAACEQTWSMISMAALGAGTRTIIPRPCGQCHEDHFVPRFTEFLGVIGPFLKSILPVPAPEIGQHFSDAFTQLQSLSEPPEIALVLLRFAALQFERAVTFVVARSELIAEKSIGVSTAKSAGPTAPLMFKIPLEANSVMQEVVEKGRLYYGQRSDTVLSTMVHKEIGAPRSPKVMAVPLISRGRVIAVTYADFGSKPVTPPQITLLEALARHAGSILDNALYRKSIDKSA